jgi:type II secretory pathway pseudopilin PulG
MHAKQMISGGRLLQIVMAGALAVAALPAAVAADAAAAQIDALQKRVTQLEEANDRQSDQLAQAKANVPSWVPNFTWSGDFRYRNETIDQEFVRKDRNRDRFRLRAGFVAKVNDTVKVGVQLASSEPGSATGDGGDPRSSNQTLTKENSRKAIFIDLAYAEWSPNQYLKFTAGKMKYPWVRAGQSTFFDGDVNPEGLAVNLTRGAFFGSVFYNILEERFGSGLTNQAASTGFNTNSNLLGGQLGWKGDVGPGKLTVGAGYFGYHGVQYRNVFWNNSTGNNTTLAAASCYYGATSCLAYGYTIVEVIAEYSYNVAGRPLTAYVDFAKNGDADDSLVATVDGLDTAQSIGVLYGKAGDARTWEVGGYWQKIERDALYGQTIDSDFAGGNTDGKGWVLKGAYAPAKNWTLNATYFINKTNNDIEFTSGAPIGTVKNRGYDRLQLDLNFKF